MSTARSVKVSCFEISQVPERQTDYEFVRADPTVSPALTKWLKQSIHKTLAEPLISTEALVITYGDFSPDNETQICICRFWPTKANGRPILHMQAVVVPLSDLQRSAITPLELFFSDVWEKFTPGNAHTVTAKVWHPTAQHSNAFHNQQLLQEVAQALEGTVSPMEIDAGLDHSSALVLIEQSLQLINSSQRYQLNIAVGIPKNTKLATNPSLTIVTRGPQPTAVPETETSNVVNDHERNLAHSGKKNNVSRSLDNAADMYIDFIEQLAGEITNLKLEPVWKSRLWNKCQDVITNVEMLRNTRKNGVNHGSNHYHILRLNDELMTDLARSRAIYNSRISGMGNSLRFQAEKFIHYAFPVPLWTKALIGSIGSAVILMVVWLILQLSKSPTTDSILLWAIGLTSVVMVIWLIAEFVRSPKTDILHGVIGSAVLLVVIWLIVEFVRSPNNPTLSKQPGASSVNEGNRRRDGRRITN